MNEPIYKYLEKTAPSMNEEPWYYDHYQPYLEWSTVGHDWKGYETPELIREMYKEWWEEYFHGIPIADDDMLLAFAKATKDIIQDLIDIKLKYQPVCTGMYNNTACAHAAKAYDCDEPEMAGCNGGKGKNKVNRGL